MGYGDTEALLRRVARVGLIEKLGFEPMRDR